MTHVYIVVCYMKVKRENELTLHWAEMRVMDVWCEIKRYTILCSVKECDVV